MISISQVLIVTGIVLVVAGLLWFFAERVGIGFGKLPGDFSFGSDDGKFRFYFPLATSIILSILISLVFIIISRLR